MKKGILLAAVIALITFNSCEAKREIPKDTPFISIDQKTEDGDRVEFATYENVNGYPDWNKLKAFCLAKKDTWDGRFYALIVIDDKKYAIYPSGFASALYNVMDDKEVAIMKHVKAVYSYNAVNGFSELTTYETNMFEGKSYNEKIK